MEIPAVGRLFEIPAVDAGEETFLPLIQRPAFLLEKIESRGAASPAGFWDQQESSEWVMLARGEASLRFEPDVPVELAAGDHLLIPAGCRHRVERTSPDAVWLALHFDKPGTP